MNKTYTYILLFLIPVMFVASRPTRPWVKTPIRPRIIRDLAGYSKPDGDRAQDTGFFDKFGLVNPANGISMPSGVDTVYGWPRNQNNEWFPSGNVDNNWWPGNRGCRVVIDLTGAKDMNDTTHLVHVTDFYGWYNANIQAGDTMFIYDLQVMMRAAPQNRWIYLARPDSVMTPIATLVTTNHFTGLWDSASVDVTGRYFMLRVIKHDHGSFTSIADFSEVSIYGTYNYDTSALNKRPDTYSGPYAAKPTYGQSTGSCFIGGIDTLETTAQGIFRYFGFMDYWDSTSTQSTLGSVTYTFDHFPDIGPTQYFAYSRAHQQFWWSIRGASKYLETQHPGATINIDAWGDDPEGPYYTRDAHFYFNYAAKWGARAVPSGQTVWTGDGGFSNGQNVIHYVENGNEDDAFASALCEWQRSSADYDSLKAADPTFNLIMSATTDRDTCRVDNYAWFSQLFRPDKIFIFSVVNFHWYIRNFTYLGHTPTVDQEVGAYGYSAEAGNLYTAYIKYANAVYNYLDGYLIPIYNTELGYNLWGTPAPNNSVSSFWAQQCVPPRGSWDSTQYNAILQLRAELEIPFTPVQGFTEYAYNNADLSCTINSNIFTSCGETGARNSSAPFNSTCKYPKWYTRHCAYDRLKWYVPISSSGITDTLGYAHLLYQKIDSASGQPTDSICDIIYKTTQSAATLSSVNVSLNGYRLNNQVQKMIPSFTSPVGTTSTVSMNAATLSLATQDEMPTFFFSRQLSYPQFWRGNKLRIFKPLN